MSDLEIAQFVINSILYFCLGIVVSIIVAIKGKLQRKEDAAWWAIFSLLFPIFYLLFKFFEWVMEWLLYGKKGK